MNISDFSTEDLEREIERRELVQAEFQRRIYCGEIEATDADGIETMAHQG